jgi:hypothetical protein
VPDCAHIDVRLVAFKCFLSHLVFPLLKTNCVFLFFLSGRKLVCWSP